MMRSIHTLYQSAILVFFASVVQAWYMEDSCLCTYLVPKRDLDPAKRSVSCSQFLSFSCQCIRLYQNGG